MGDGQNFCQLESRVTAYKNYPWKKTETFSTKIFIEIVLDVNRSKSFLTAKLLAFVDHIV